MCHPAGTHLQHWLSAGCISGTKQDTLAIGAGAGAAVIVRPVQLCRILIQHFNISTHIADFLETSSNPLLCNSSPEARCEQISYMLVFINSLIYQ